MKKSLLLITTAFLLSCGKTNNAHVKVLEESKKQSCTVAQSSYGADIICPDGSQVFIPNGSNGTNGSSCSVEQLTNGAKISCTDGTFAYIYNGKDGLNGSSCTVTSISGGAKISCEDGTEAYALNGTNGQSCTVTDLANGALVQCGATSAVIYDGEDALSGAIGIAGYIKPCGAEFNNDEILLRLTDGNILALYDGGPHEDRLVLLAPGNYITTDRNKNKTCHFTVTSDLQITNQYVD